MEKYVKTKDGKTVKLTQKIGVYAMTAKRNLPRFKECGSIEEANARKAEVLAKGWIFCGAKSYFLSEKNSVSNIRYIEL